MLCYYIYYNFLSVSYLYSFAHADLCVAGLFSSFNNFSEDFKLGRAAGAPPVYLQDFMNKKLFKINTFLGIGSVSFFSFITFVFGLEPGFMYAYPILAIYLSVTTFFFSLQVLVFSTIRLYYIIKALVTGKWIVERDEVVSRYVRTRFKRDAKYMKMRRVLTQQSMREFLVMRQELDYTRSALKQVTKELARIKGRKS